MRKSFWILTVIVLFISCKNHGLNISVVNNSLIFRDSVKIKIENKTDKNYLFYFKRTRFDYFPNSKNVLIAEINNDDEPVKIELSSDPLYILNEDGTYDDDDIKEMNTFRKLALQNLIKVVPGKSSIFFNMKLIDTLNERGGKEYPVLEKGKSYKLTLKMDIDSNLIGEKELENIRSKYKNDITIFQGKLVSNTINVN